jgi:hypothetical protein
MAARAGLTRGEGFPHGVRIGSNAATGKPIFEFGNAHDESTIVTDATSGAAVAEAVQAAEESTSLPQKASFVFADLQDQAQGKWSSISLEDLKVRFAVCSVDPVQNLY